MNYNNICMLFFLRAIYVAGHIARFDYHRPDSSTSGDQNSLVVSCSCIHLLKDMHGSAMIVHGMRYDC